MHPSQKASLLVLYLPICLPIAFYRLETIDRLLSPCQVASYFTIYMKCDSNSADGRLIPYRIDVDRNDWNRNYRHLWGGGHYPKEYLMLSSEVYKQMGGEYVAFCPFSNSL